MFTEEAWYIDGNIIWCGDDNTHIHVVVTHLLQHFVTQLKAATKAAKDRRLDGLIQVFEGWTLDEHWDGPGFRENILNYFDLGQKNRLFTREEADNCYDVILEFLGPWWKKTEGFNILLEASDSKGHSRCPRDWACEHWDWIRLEQQHIQVWRLTDDTAAQIVQMLDLVYSDDVEYEEFETAEFQIEESKTKHLYRNISVRALREPVYQLQ